jgi:hypothetical protein
MSLLEDGSHDDQDVGAVLHIAGVLLLFVTLGFEWVTAALSPSPTLRWAERWARRSLRWQIAAAAVILASGVAMAARLEVFHLAWLNVSLVVLLLIAALARIASRSRRRAGRFALASSGLPRSRSAWLLAPGVFYLMVAKSGIVESLIVVAVALALGAVRATRAKLAIRVASGDASGSASVRLRVASEIMPAAAGSAWGRLNSKVIPCMPSPVPAATQAARLSQV